MKTHHKKLAGAVVIALGLVGSSAVAQTSAGQTSDKTRPTSGSQSAHDPALTPSPQGTGSTIGQRSPASPAGPVDQAGRSIDRGSGVNPNRVDSSSSAVGVDRSRPRTDSMGGLAAGDGQQHKKASDVIGKTVRGAGNEDFGQIRDLVVDPQSGQIGYAIVSSGGVLGIGGTRRAVPFSALSRSGDDDSMMIHIDKQRWDNSPQFRDDDLATLNQETRAREIYQHFGQNWEDEARMRATTSTAQQALASSTAREGGLLLVSDLKDKDINSANQKVGEVEDVLINAERRTASLLVELEDDFVDSDENYVIGFNQLNVAGTGRDLVLTTQLTSVDFQGGATARTDVGIDRPYVWREGQEGQTTRTTSPTVAAQSHPNSGLAATREGANYATADVTPSSHGSSSSSIAPISGGTHTAGQGTVTDSMTADARRTGTTTTSGTTTDSEERVRFADSTANPQNRPTVSAREKTSSTSPAAQSSQSPQRQADAVRQALQDDASLRTVARNVEVDARGERLVLSGDVASQDERERVLRAARRAAGAQQIDDQLRVRGAAE